MFSFKKKNKNNNIIIDKTSIRCFFEDYLQEYDYVYYVFRMYYNHILSNKPEFNDLLNYYFTTCNDECKQISNFKIYNMILVITIIELKPSYNKERILRDACVISAGTYTNNNNIYCFEINDFMIKQIIFNNPLDTIFIEKYLSCENHAKNNLKSFLNHHKHNLSNIKEKFNNVDYVDRKKIFFDTLHKL
jgi:hypothetical protein